MEKVKYHPILFSTPMIQAIMENRKKQTRRTKGLELFNEKTDRWKYDGINELDGCHYMELISKDGKFTENYFEVKCPYNVGDVLWVRETWQIDYPFSTFCYKADSKRNHVEKWKPSLFMPKSACRLFLRIKSIRAERLQDISEGDAIAEGAKDRLRHTDLKVLEGLKDWVIPSPFLQHQFGFLAIWCTINGCDNWLQNPFVWVYEFEKIEKPKDFG